MEFNKTVHQADDNGDPVRNDDGTIRLKTNWKDLAVDHKGRTYNKLLHGERHELDDSGLLKMQRRDAARKPMTMTNKTADFVNRFKKANDGYSYRLFNDEGGRIAQAKQHDWEPVQDSSGVATMPVGQARQAGTKAILMRKPEEWYDADQIEKDRLLNANLESKTKPAEGQYGEGLKTSSPLR